MEKLSIKKSIKNDYILMLSVCMMLIGIVFFILYKQFGIKISKHAGVIDISNGEDLFYELIWIIMFASGIVIAVLRYIVLKSIFQSGVKINATVSSVNFYGDRGRAEFFYEYSGVQYNRGVALHQTKETRGLNVGDQIALLIDENNPKHFLIHSLYCEE
ncbi:MAG: hypothetical protein J6X37_01260 [Treponema sp.]|nr:hypothetical protein [Treponema sp.]